MEAIVTAEQQEGVELEYLLFTRNFTNNNNISSTELERNTSSISSTSISTKNKTRKKLTKFETHHHHHQQQQQQQQHQQTIANKETSDKKLGESVSLLKDLIGKLSKSHSSVSSGTSATPLQITHQPSSLESIFELAKTSVTLSFRDYLQFQKYTTKTPRPNHLINMLSFFDPDPSSSSSNSSDNYLQPYSYLFKNRSHQITPPPPILLEANDQYTRLTPSSGVPTLLTSTHSQSIAIGFFYSILIITSLVSNPLLIYVLLWRRKAQIKLIDIFVANLSLSDLFLTIFNIPLSLIIYFAEQWPFGSLVCQLGTYSTSCSIYVNIFTMAYISIDRYFAVTRPLISNPLSYQLRKKSILVDCRTRRKIYLVLALIWIISLLLSLPQLFFTKVRIFFCNITIKTPI
jgi:hypothetical protein